MRVTGPIPGLVLCLSCIEKPCTNTFMMKAPSSGATRKVVKFGGSSLSTPQRMREVASIIKGIVLEGTTPTVVCSAIGKTTNNLLDCGQEAMLQGTFDISVIQTLHLKACQDLELGLETESDIRNILLDLGKMLTGLSMLGELTPRSKDKLVSHGEMMSIRILSATLNKEGIRSQHMDISRLGLQTNADFGNAEVLDSSYPSIRRALYEDMDVVSVVPGFVGKSPCNQTTTLGRGGSDLTAMVVGSAIDADEVQLWKDVDGMMTANPKEVPWAVSVPRVSYEEASEMAYFGANILHPLSMYPAIKTGTPIRIKNSFNPSHPGTIISRDIGIRDGPVVAITCKKGIDLIDIVSTRMLGQCGFLSKVFQLFSENSLSIDMIATSEVSVSLTLDQDQNEPRIKKCVNQLRDVADVTENKNTSIISLVSDGSRSSEVMADVFRVMKRSGIKVLMVSQGASKVNIGIVVPGGQVLDAMNALHHHFFEG